MTITPGWLGEFTVCLDDGRPLARRRWLRPPTIDAVLDAVARALDTHRPSAPGADSPGEL